MPETRLHLDVIPGASGTGVTRAGDGIYRVRVMAPARDGKANRELLRYLADLLGVPKSAVTLERGQSSRHKVVAVLGLDSSQIARKLDGAAAR